MRNAHMGPPSADVAWLQVNLKSGKVYSVVLDQTARSTSVLHGAPMWRLLREWLPRFKAQVTRMPRRSLQTSKGLVRNDAQAHFAWER